MAYNYRDYPLISHSLSLTPARPYVRVFVTAAAFVFLTSMFRVTVVSAYHTRRITDTRTPREFGCDRCFFFSKVSHARRRDNKRYLRAKRSNENYNNIRNRTFISALEKVENVELATPFQSRTFEA